MPAAYQKRARRNWRQRRREAGMGWQCVIGNHGPCSGFVGRLVPTGVLRPECTCPCHEDDEFQKALGERTWTA
jgi:hypothetical protein